MAFPKALVSSMKGRENFGMAKTGALVIATLSHSKAFCASGVQLNFSLHKSEVKGGGNGGISFDELTIETRESEESSQVLLVVGEWPLEHRDNLGLVWFDSITENKMS